LDGKKEFPIPYESITDIPHPNSTILTQPRQTLRISYIRQYNPFMSVLPIGTPDVPFLIR